MGRYRVRRYRSRGKKVKLSPLQSVDFMIIWSLFMVAIFLFLPPVISGGMIFFDSPILLIGILVVIILYLPLRRKAVKEQRENEENEEKILQSGISEIDLMEGVIRLLLFKRNDIIKQLGLRLFKKFIRLCLITMQPKVG